jgi:hypothetical protein
VLFRSGAENYAAAVLRGYERSALPARFRGGQLRRAARLAWVRGERAAAARAAYAAILADPGWLLRGGAPDVSAAALGNDA